MTADAPRSKENPVPPDTEKTDPGGGTNPGFTAPQVSLGGLFSTMRDVLVAVLLGGLGFTAKWIWEVDRSVATMQTQSEQYVTQSELIEFVATQRETNKKVELLYEILVVRKLGD